MILLEALGNPYLGIFILVLLAMFGVPVLFSIIALFLRKKKPEVAKKLFIAAVIYLVIGLGTCGLMINS